MVSTHSRVEAAAALPRATIAQRLAFQHTAAWRRLRVLIKLRTDFVNVSTHSRVEAAA